MKLLVLRTWRAHPCVGDEASGHSPGQQERAPLFTPSHAVDFVGERQSEHDCRKLDDGHSAVTIQQLSGVLPLAVPPGEVYLCPQLGKAEHFLLFCVQFLLQEKAKRGHQSSRKLLEAFGATGEERIADGGEQAELLHFVTSVAAGRVFRIVARSHVGHVHVALVHAFGQLDGRRFTRFAERGFLALHEHTLVEETVAVNSMQTLTLLLWAFGHGLWAFGHGFWAFGHEFWAFGHEFCKAFWEQLRPVQARAPPADVHEKTIVELVADFPCVQPKQPFYVLCELPEMCIQVFCSEFLFGNFPHARRYVYGNHDTSHVGQFLWNLVQVPEFSEFVHRKALRHFHIFRGRLCGRAVDHVFGACQRCTRKQNQVAACEADPLPVFVEGEHLIVIIFHCQAFTLLFPRE